MDSRRRCIKDFRFCQFKKDNHYQSAVSVEAKKRENTACMTRKHKFLSGHQDDLCAGGLRCCTNQQPPQRGGVVPGPVWVGSK